MGGYVLRKRARAPEFFLAEVGSSHSWGLVWCPSAGRVNGLPRATSAVLFSQLDAASQLTVPIGCPMKVNPSLAPNRFSVAFVTSSRVPWAVSTGVVYGRFCSTVNTGVVRGGFCMLFILPSFANGVTGAYTSGEHPSRRRRAAQAGALGSWWLLGSLRSPRLSGGGLARKRQEPVCLMGIIL